MKITAKKLLELPDGQHWIDRSLYLRKRAGRKPCWFFNYQVAGKRKIISLGSLQDISLTQARAMADEYRHMILNFPAFHPLKSLQNLTLR